ncbi:decarboxylating cobalt-precorrin-6B (C(15))-methyltransferase [Limosilactobacillus sp. STM2_1]|uniref:Decarboxylating cobalt-precorrin-6B (C(15))-methyltransferase n=1 Tax=Limosilactobacillus rudii TaxID=2759755 RepID=A0A7W3UKU7_9LACO|nr:decarboxylating cobalt-precorrin-6B (C(15))-methyltransferase [Limosilactobacillus rudii]MBB1079420.1 decarboxylating cobalt-precorrin-6B (C(15))-methyltransferase [Limosilactobacillus rudii]MBB1097466.1 decarboxylating cobalt-precorrin-6B (C(15))-methyltransferase [Limosilactobacillus rudii]MCD7134575.1 decarboxylating cobalt-precorrin-6B (C(15))-methyltransferase [Limosilactobacillus rudii]
MRDDEFLRNKVPMTKSEVRAISIDKLNLIGKKSMLDVGAGTGSVSIQAAHEFNGLTVTAIEMNPDGIDIINQNINKFALKNIRLIKGTAPEDIPEQKYDAIFVGGSGSHLDEIINFASDHLNANGTIVLNFILFENAMQVEQLLQENDFKNIEMIEVGVLRWHKLGKGHFFKPNNPTIIVSARK